jgi:hypothetical protein
MSKFLLTDPICGTLRHAALSALLLSAPTMSAAVGLATPRIDRDLADAIDLRNEAFAGCYGTSSCTIQTPAGGLTVRGYRLTRTGGEWLPAALYWDPVDGFGVLSGGQDDEIDIDEMIEVTFAEPVRLSSIWLTDLFVDEARHYGPADARPRAGDAETASVELFAAGTPVTRLEVTGNLALPNLSFNESVAPELFDSGGDLRKRLIIEDDSIVLLNAVRTGGGTSGETIRVNLEEALIGKIDADKAEVFADLAQDQEANLDLIAEYARPLDVELFPEGSTNAQRIAGLVDNAPELQALTAAAQVGRSVGDVPNGEVSADFGTPVAVDRIRFRATASTSNDFSVAGFVIE